MKDPFASRAQPAADVCTTTNLIVSAGRRTLTPGVYCGGLKITTGAAVTTLSPGVYVLKNGPLVVDKQSSLTADGAGFFLTGANAVLAIDDTTTVNMKARQAGPLAGMLFFEDRSVPVGQTHLFRQPERAAIARDFLSLPKQTGRRIRTHNAGHGHRQLQQHSKLSGSMPASRNIPRDPIGLDHRRRSSSGH